MHQVNLNAKTQRRKGLTFYSLHLCVFAFKLLAFCTVCFILLLAALTDVVYATDYKPWYGRVLEPVAEADIRFQLFKHVNSPHCRMEREELDTFIDLSAGMAIDQDLAAELEIIALQSKTRSFGMDAIRFTGRYRFLNDIVDDPVSLSTGLTLSSTFPSARKNIATFDHGGIAGEAHVSIGRELSCMQFWISRAYSVFAIGVADVGSPWLRANISWEHNWYDSHRLEIFTETLWGLGGNNLNQVKFRGYGPINYQAIDLGARYSYQADYGILFSFGLGYRVYARNCPENVNFILFRLEYPL